MKKTTQHIPTTDGHKPPESIRPVAKRKPAPHRKRTPTQTLLSQSAYQETLPKGERGMIVLDELPDGWPVGVPLPDNVALKSGRNNEKFYQRSKRGQNLTKAIAMESIKRKAGQKVTEWLLSIAMVIFRKIRDIVIDNFLSFGIYRKDEFGNPVPKIGADGVPVTRDGKPVYEIAWGSTLLSVVAKWRGEIAFLGAAMGYTIGGSSVFEWLERLVNLFGL